MEAQPDVGNDHRRRVLDEQPIPETTRLDEEGLGVRQSVQLRRMGAKQDVPPHDDVIRQFDRRDGRHPEREDGCGTPAPFPHCMQEEGTADEHGGLLREIGAAHEEPGGEPQRHAVRQAAVKVEQDADEREALSDRFRLEHCGEMQLDRKRRI